MKTITHFRLLAVAILISVSALGSLSFSQTAPSVLFHWTSARGLSRWNQQIVSQNEFRLKPLLQSIFTTAYPAFENKDGIFAWSDVANGTGAFVGGQKEMYAREDRSTGEAARMVAVFLDPGVPLVTLDTYIDRSGSLPVITEMDPKGSLPETLNAGLILHRVIDVKTNEIFLQEYVLLKRRIISGMSADTADTAEYMEQALDRLKDPTPFPQSALHTVTDSEAYGLNSVRTRQFVTGILERAMVVPSHKIPDFFRGNGTIPRPEHQSPASCMMFL